MTVLKYNHNSMLLVRASHLVPLLLFVVSTVPWVRVALPRQAQRKAQTLLHWGNKHCWASARSSARAPSPASNTAFRPGFFSFPFWSRSGVPLHIHPHRELLMFSYPLPAENIPIFIMSAKNLFAPQGELFGVHLNQCSAMDTKKGPRWAPQIKRSEPIQLPPKYIFYTDGTQQPCRLAKPPSAITEGCFSADFSTWGLFLFFLKKKPQQNKNLQQSVRSEG